MCVATIVLLVARNHDDDEINDEQSEFEKARKVCCFVRASAYFDSSQHACLRSACVELAQQ